MIVEQLFVALLFYVGVMAALVSVHASKTYVMYAVISGICFAVAVPILVYH